MLEWKADRSEDFTYHYADVEGEDDEVIGAALEQWWAKMCENAEASEDWDCLVADMWVETGRLIGHVQRGNQAVGYDRGWRVCLTFVHVTDTLHKADYDEDVWDTMAEVIATDVYASLHRPAVQKLLKGLHAKNPFEAVLSHEGGGGEDANQQSPLEFE